MNSGISVNRATLDYRFIVAILLVVLLSGTYGLLSVSEASLRQVENERLIAETREKLILDLKMLQKSSRPENHLGSFFYRRLSEYAVSLADNSNWESSLHQNLSQQFRAWKLDPEWLVFSFNVRAGNDLEFFGDQKLMPTFSNGRILSENADVCKMLALKGMQTFANLQLSKEFWQEVGPRTSAVLDERSSKNQTEYIRAALASFKKIYFNNQPLYLAWFPLFDAEWQSSRQRFSALDLKSFDSRDFSLMHFRGLVMVGFSEKDFQNLAVANLKKILAANFAATGCRVRFSSVDEKIDAQLQIKENRLAMSAVITIDRDYLVTVERDAVLLLGNRRFSSFLAFCLKLCWFSSGLFFIGNHLLLRRPVATSLARQLVIFTSWMLFPAFFMGFTATERYVIEKQTAAMASLKQRVIDVASAFDRSIEIYKTWLCTSIEDSLARNITANQMDMKKLEPEKLALLVKEMKKEMLKNGLFAKSLILVDSSGKIFSDLFKAKEKESKFFEQFFRAFYSPAVVEKTGSSPRSAARGASLLADAQSEELVEIARNVLSPEKVSGMAINPSSLDQLVGFGEQAFIYHKYAGMKTKAQIVIQVGVFIPSLERTCMLDWIDNFAEPKLSELIWVISRKSFSSWMLRAPFWRANVTGEMGLLSPIFDFLPPPLLFLQQLLGNAKESAVTTFRLGAEEFLFVSIPGVGMMDYTISAMLPLKEHFLELETFRRRLLAAMAMIFILSSLIGMRLARSFIAPLQALAEKAEQITAGNFAVNMSVHGESQEFIELSTQFNRVVQDLETGKTLSRFVSAGALEVIRDQSDRSFDCNLVSAVVMFLRLDGFWKDAATKKPQEAVFALNQFFSLICMEVKRAGGDVSKFIGEKAMAVFAAENSEQLRDIAARVSECALRISALSQSGAWGIGGGARIGITAGSVISGILGDQNTLLEQTVIGDSVNLAARLCTLESADAVLADAAFAELISDRKFQLAPLPVQMIKGKKIAVKVFALKGVHRG